MQKKSLLVALFCGALCLTGCLKNEESASVAQVRIAKANELNSVAKLNEAKAQAEVIYANAEATIAKAEAALKEAQANLVNAQAETEKVRAELLKVRVQLETVKVEEERINLQKMEAELEIALANAEAAKAAAKWAEQYWINQLAQLAADAEVAAIENAQALMEAENEILKLEGARADSAKVYAQLYFTALDSIANLQAKEIAVKVVKVLAEREAISTRDAIHELIDMNNQEIEDNNAKIAAFEKYQTMDTTEAKAQLQVAYTALNEAYNAYKKTKDAEDEAEAALAESKNKTSDFFKGDWQTVMDALVAVPGMSISGPQDVPVEVGDETVDANAGGFVVLDEEGEPEFLPLFSDEATKPKFARYPDVDVYAKNHRDHEHLTTTLIAPAALYYDNIELALDTVLARQQKYADYQFARVETWNNFMKERAQEFVDEYTSKNELQQKYVDARKAAVEEAEEAFIAEIGKYEEYTSKKQETWQAFQEYMLLKTDVSRQYFVEQYMADTAYAKAYNDSLEAAIALEGVVAGIPALKEAVQEAFEDAAEAEGNLNRLKEKRDDASTLAGKTWVALNAAAERWNPKFAELVAAGEEPKFDGYQKPDSYNYEPNQSSFINLETPKHWYVKDSDGNKVYAKSAQDSLYSAKYNLAIADAALYEADVDSLRSEIAKATYDAVKDRQKTYKEVLKGTSTKDGIETIATAAYQLYETCLKAYNETIGDDIAKAKEAWNPAVDIFEYVTFPTEAQPNHRKYEVKPGKYNPDGTWANGVAGTTQVALFEAVTDVWKAEKDAKIQEPADDKDVEDYTNGETYYVAEEAARIAMGNLIDKSKELMIALGADEDEIDDMDLEELVAFIEENIGDYIDEEANKLYQAFLDVENESEYEDALEALWKLYLGYNPDGIDKWENRPDFNDDDFEDAEFGWLRSSYNVDYEATYVNLAGEREPIYWILYPRQANQETHSYKYMIEAAQKEIDENIPERIAGSKDWWENTYMKYVKDQITDALAVVNGFKAHETTYKAWVAEREAAEEALNEAKKARFDAHASYKEAQAEYDAIKAVVDEGVWVYDPNNVLADEDEHNFRGFVKLNIKEQIQKLEKENEDLEEENAKLRQLLSDGKTALAVLNQILDETIAELEEAIEIWTAIANKYKGLMNAYLGIVPNEDENGETGPLDGEGDDEE